jgi:hypothetical protein
MHNNAQGWHISKPRTDPFTTIKLFQDDLKIFGIKMIN